MATPSDPRELTELELRTHEWLKKEIESAVHETRALERYTLVGTAVVWAFLVKDAYPRAPDVLWWIPFVLSILAGLRVLALYVGIAPRASYLKEIEKMASHSGGPAGWEQHWEGAPSRTWDGRTAILFWVLLILATGLIPFRVITQLGD
ncbi:MAG: hypothetical protein ACREOQ_22095 [Gemmatimonadales bacterium]